MSTLRDTFDLEAMKAELIRDEGLVLEVYKDPGSGRAIGVGRNLDTQGLSAAEAVELGLRDRHSPIQGTEAVDAINDILKGSISKAAAMTLLVNDITDRAHQLDVYLPWWRLLSPVRQRVLLNMAFEMGSHGMVNYFNGGGPASYLWGAIQQARWGVAAGTMESSPWGQGKTHNRAARLAEAMRHG